MSMRMDDSNVTDITMDITGIHNRTQPLESLLNTDSPRALPDFSSQTFKRRSLNVDVRRSMQLLDEAVATPESTPAARTQRLLRHSTYTPKPAFSATTPTIFEQPETSLLQTSRNTSLLPQHGSSSIGATFETTIGDVTTTNVSRILEEDVGLSASDGVYDDFMHSLKRHPSPTQVFDLLHEYINTCADQVLLFKKLLNRITVGQEKHKKTYEIKRLLEEESRTWQLMHSLYKDRLGTDIQQEMGDDDDEDMMVDDIPVYNSDKNIVNRLYEKNPAVRQSQAVVDWLESCSRERLDELADIFSFADKPVSWENTLHHLMRKSSSMPTGTDRAIVDEIDPDAPRRQNKLLDDLDQEDEERLLQYMLVCIRSGQLDKAQEACLKSGQAWRAATLDGWQLYHDPNYDGLGPDGQVQPIEGNKFRDIWKASCWAMAQDPHLNMVEKAIYASLSGHLKALLPVCNSWGDYLWAHIKVYIDTLVENEIRLKTKLNRKMEPLPEGFGAKNLDLPTVFQEIEACPLDVIRSESKEEFHLIQKYIILGDVDELIDVMYTISQREKSQLPMHLIRFMAHIVLFLRRIENSKKEELCDAILERYVEYLIDTRHKDQIAYYVATLPSESQVHWYAKFLEGIREKEEQHSCLLLAGDAGLDIPLITKTVVENIRKRDAGDSKRDSISAETEISEEDRQKIESIDWLVFDPSQRSEALKQANAVMRGFITFQKYVAAREVFKKLPQDTVSVVYRTWQRQKGSPDLPPADENAVREYMCIKAVLDAHKSFNDWFDLYHNSKPTRPSQSSGGTFTDRVAFEHKMKQYESELERWHHSLLSQTQITTDHIYNVLLFANGGWMVDQRQVEETDKDESRRHEMTLLRETTLPSMCFLLHKVLHSTEQYTKCMALADCIASEQHALYKVFKREDLKHFLKLIHDSSLCLLDQNKDPLGFDLV